ncbi:Iron uptake system component EfeO precursor [Vibrio aerogenes CECT 7868]|uniref:Iron uptake system component EfeO n=1 Tax=Vibrio aerogenes CECT 7868 TaxID=1216006 RepID=A0A1M5ZUM2_9VIBR|nr:cupredoxin domain-containing protein [Vibrio aerogenes]SHI27902.1 Iron uptake system component EfeO precursor [Vibrio aerogenes CECT 7868]
MKLWNQALSLFSGCLISALAYAAEIPQIKVTVTDKQCEPMQLTVPAGQVRFVITNKSMRALEWEILNGVMVVAERENIAPGFYQKMTVDLEPGTYETTCGLLTNPHGSLVVQSHHHNPYQLKVQDKIRITAEYKFFLIQLSRQLDKAADNWNRASINPAQRTLYYQLQTLAGAFQRADDRDLADMAGKDRLSQIKAWTQLFRGQTLHLGMLLSRFEALLGQQTLNHDHQQAIQTNLNKLIELVKPLLDKADPDLSEKLAKDFSVWQSDDTQNNQQRLRQDLQKLHLFIDQGES